MVQHSADMSGLVLMTSWALEHYKYIFYIFEGYILSSQLSIRPKKSKKISSTHIVLRIEMSIWTRYPLTHGEFLY